MPKPDLLFKFFLLLALLTLGWQTAVAQTTAFNYQGKLTDAGNPANGSYDMQFKLFDNATVGTGTQQGTTLINPTVQVTAGSFSVTLDFGANVFDGSPRFLEIGVRPAGNPNPYTVLSPRQPINSAPYAINTRQLGGLAATRYVATDTNGNVGIGTTTPSTKLEVVDPVRQLRFGPTTADNGGYLISTAPHQAIIAGGARWDATASWIARDTTASITAHHFGTIQFATNDGLTVGSTFSPNLRMTIEANGNVAIGTPSAAPGYKVDINTNGGGVRAFFNNSTHFVAETTGDTNAWAKYIMKTPNHQWAMGTSQNFNGDQLYFADDTAGQIRMAIEANGNVVIGTPSAAPGYKVDINTNGGGVRSFYNGSTHFVAETMGGTNSWAKYIMKTPNRQWAIGTSQNFNGDQLYISDETAGQIRLFIDTTGIVSVPILNIRGGADFSENFDISEASGATPGTAAKAAAPGLVVSIDQKNPGKLVVSRQAYDRSVAGIISGAGGISPGLVMGQKGSTADGNYPVALTGRVWVYADAARSAIKPGDLLTTSATPGHAMKVTNYSRAHGAIIGKAMTGLKSGRGLVLVLVSLQ